MLHKLLLQDAASFKVYFQLLRREFRGVDLAVRPVLCDRAHCQTVRNNVAQFSVLGVEM